MKEKIIKQIEQLKLEQQELIKKYQEITEYSQKLVARFTEINGAISALTKLQQEVTQNEEKSNNTSVQ